MIHTFEVKSAITHSQASNLIESLSVDALTTPLELKDPFGEHGYQKLILTKAPHPINANYLSLVIELQSLVNSRVCVELFELNCENVKVLKQLMSLKFLELEKLYGISQANWYLARLNIAKQVRTDDVELLVRLFKRAKCPFKSIQ